MHATVNGKPKTNQRAPRAAPGWLWRMAWRDSRRSRRRLLLFISAITLGIAALVGINSFGDNLARSVDEQARELLGADLVLSTNRPPDRSATSYLAGLARDPNVVERSREVAFASMASFPKTGGVRLAQVKALEGGFPYYGAWETTPASAVSRFRTAQTQKIPVALVDDALLVQFGAQPGDSVKIGNVLFQIAGRVLKTPGQSAVSSTVAPTVFIPAHWLPETDLLQFGSRAQYRFYYQFRPGANVEAFVKTREARLDKLGLDPDTVASRKQQTGRAFADLTKFLNLVAFVALLLGCVGVASAVNLYVKEKLPSVAVLRCLGASGRQAFLIYLLQTTLMGLLGAVMGAGLGSLVQLALPRVFGNFLPIAVQTALSWPSVAQGVAIGVVMAVLFALLPLLQIRRVSPLRTLRTSFDEDVVRPDPLRWLVYVLIPLFVAGFAYWQTADAGLALGFTGGLLVAFAVLTGLGQLLIAAVRRYFPRSWSYVWRQSLANLYRPQNQTLILVTAIGLGAFLIATLYLTQGLLLGRVQFSASGNQPNMVLFDIQSEQRAGVRQLLAERKLPVLQDVPIVTMRLAEINGRSIEAIRNDSTAKIPEWALTREYRVTYRDSLIASEKLTAGTAPNRENGLPNVSLEKGYLDRLKLKLGDTLTFDVQGARIPTVVGGTREVDWNRVQTNFLVVFPNGVLEQAPQFHVLMTRVPGTDVSAGLQRELVSRFPNVSAIDLSLILRTLDDILDKIAFAIRFMALFSVLTGLLVLGSSVVISKYQRIRESVLLRTLGASRSQMLRITLIEYGMLGALAGLAGISLSLLGTWALAYFVFEVPYRPDVAPLLAIVGTVAALAALIGLFNSREVLVRPPLEVLRADA